ncbi:transcriptional regulator [Fulvitalea axinellae]|uniref:Transcriptional regulator n=1 Tax=Fulvitalea axinellae TaxID=1182444 RepID=A0AAU9CQ99_9BACT|nr:transcriptional regulator [Fulvitalea axinellae]
MENTDNLKKLTRAEDEVMQILWKLDKGVVKDVIAEMPAPKPAYNTVSTIIRILERKGFVSHKAYGKTYEYFPLITKAEYSNFYLKSFMGSYFGGSFRKLVSFFVNENDIDSGEMQELMNYVKDKDKTPEKGNE